MLFSHKKKPNKKELEYKKIRSVSKKEESFRFFKSFYRIFFYFLFTVFVGVVIYAILFSPFLAVGRVEINKLDKIEQSEVFAVAQSVYQGKYLGIFPKMNFLLFPENTLSSVLMDNFKRIKKINIRKEFPDSVFVHIEERESLLLWCDNFGECFIVDEDGVAYQNVKLDSKEALENDLIKIYSQEDRRVFEGERILAAEKVAFLMSVESVIERSAEIDILSEIHIKSRVADEIMLKNSEGWDILVSTTFPLEQAGDFMRILLEKEINSENRGRLEYVDLRVENRIYYKLKKEEQEKEGEIEKSEAVKSDSDSENKNA